ncbi:hypothetical protein ABFP25_04325 [Acinetobacter indicus]|jgi:hypothetical protein|uniref:hypothetical protein n=1 Tax=Acinetobacter indicus TaxID=756892 RepID=UPI0005F7C527|nr:hypothetical protein [Acinetobacter indicus]KJV43843.1 hypothetical protein VH96_10205 [Acinetobacter indicus]OUY09473.1 hypothetical protein CAP42_11185 [Acinetobacter indicus]
MHELQALIQRKISPQDINVENLVALAEHYSQPHSAEYKLVELALNIVLASYLEKAQQLV